MIKPKQVTKGLSYLRKAGFATQSHFYDIL